MVLYYSAVKKISRRVGMADEADSKSVVGNHVWVQVPSPAVICYYKEHDGSIMFFYLTIASRHSIKKIINGWERMWMIK